MRFPPNPQRIPTAKRLESSFRSTGYKPQATGYNYDKGGGLERMFRPWRTIFAPLIAVVLSANAFAQGGPGDEFSATMVNRSKSGEVSRARIYAGKDNIRLEPLGAPNKTYVVFSKSGTAVVVSPERKSYMEIPAAFAGTGRGVNAILRPPDPDKPCAQLGEAIKRPAECRKVGAETINGRNTVKWEYNIGARSGERDHGYAWIDPKLRTIVKSESDTGVMQLEDIQAGKQAPALFEIPPEYTKTEPPAVTPPH